MSALDLIPILRQHRQFAVVSSMGLALLYAEEGWASYNFWSQRPLEEGRVLVVVVGLIAFAGYLASFFFPPLLVTDGWDHPRPWGTFINVCAWSAGIVVVLNVAIFAVLLNLVGSNLTAAYTLLRDTYVYTLFGIFYFHGLLLYVRYMHYLYSMPDYIQPSKVISTSVGMGVVMLVVGAFLFVLDLYHFENTPAAMQPMFGLHVYARALYALTLALAAYAWHIRWIADH